MRRYRVRLFGKVTQADLDKLAKGVTIDGVRYGPVTAELERAKTSNAWAMISLKEGKNREVKSLMEHLGFKVSRLIRVSFGPFHLGHLPEGAVGRNPRQGLARTIGDNEEGNKRLTRSRPSGSRFAPAPPLPREIKETNAPSSRNRRGPRGGSGCARAAGTAGRARTRWRAGAGGSPTNAAGAARSRSAYFAA